MGLDQLKEIGAEDAGSTISVTKSASDKRSYRAMVFENKLRVMLISDKDTDKAAASLTCGVGSLSNSHEILGLAHFCEHMLFLGTEKYPVENEFDKFLNDNGGESNAYTDEDHTNYHFDVSPDQLKPALDRFAYFFISPLFTQSSTEREIQAVNSEHEQNIPDDDWRSSALQKETSNPDHPYQHFSTGNFESLWTSPKERNLDIISALLDFHGRFYSANIMTLALLGKESLDELEALAVPLFSQIKNKEVELPRWNDSPFDTDHVGVIIHVVPIKDARQMSIVFPFPDTTGSYKAASDHYLTHLLGHESSGSLMCLLKANRWANELTADIQAEGRGFGTASIELELSKDGLRHVEEIAEIVFQYIELLRQSGPQQWIWEELRDIETMNFRFKDQKSPDSTVCDLTPKMLVHPLEDALSAEYLLEKYDPEEITRLMTYLVPEKSRITILAKENQSKVNLVEKYYGINYSVEKIKPECIERWKNCGLNPGLHLPKRNEFIPSIFELKSPRDDTGIIPRKIIDGPLSRAWFLQDNEFLLPKAIVRTEIFSLLPLQSPLNQALTGLVKRLLEDSLSEVTYNANVAGLKYFLLETVYGFEIYVGGYDHKLGLLFQKVVDHLLNYQCDPERFDVIKEAYARSLKNWEKEQPRKHADWYIGYLLREKRWTHAEMLEVLQDVTADNVNTYLKSFFEKVAIEWLLYGNLTKEEALEIIAICEKSFEMKCSQGFSASEIVRLRELKLKPGSDFIFAGEHHTHSDSCTTVLFQGSLEESRNNVLIEFMDQFAYENCYSQLRTKEQLGYCVWTTVRKSNGTRGFQILVQSGFEPAYVEGRIDSCLANLHGTLKSLTEEQFLQHRNALAVRKREKPKEIGTRADTLWMEIETRQYNFNRVEIELKELETVTLKDFQEYFENLIGPSSLKRKRLNIHVVSKAKKSNKKKKVPKAASDEVTSKIIERNPVKIEDVYEWKSCHEFFPQCHHLTVEPSQ